MLPALIFMVFNGILPLIGYKYLGTAGCFTVLLISIPVSIVILLLICNASINHFVNKKLLSSIKFFPSFENYKNDYNHRVEEGKKIIAKKEEMINEQMDRYIKINFFYIFLCFMACTVFAFTIYDESLTVLEFVKGCIIPFALFDSFHFLEELSEKDNFFDAFLGVFITGSVAMIIGGGALAFMTVFYVVLQIGIGITLVILGLFVYIIHKIFG